MDEKFTVVIVLALGVLIAPTPVGRGVLDFLGQPARGALARAGHSLDSHLHNVREVLLQAILQEDAWPGVFALAAAGIESRAADLVRVCVLEERAAGTSWAQIGEPFGVSADAARKCWGHWALAPHPDDDQLSGG